MKKGEAKKAEEKQRETLKNKQNALFRGRNSFFYEKKTRKETKKTKRKKIRRV